MKLLIKRASGKATCKICNTRILKGQVQIACIGYRDSLNIHGSNTQCRDVVMERLK